MTSLRSVLVLPLAAALVLAACGGDDEAETPAGPVALITINVGSTTEPLSELLSEIYGQALENSGQRVGRKDPVADRAATYAALESGRVQLVPELSASLLAFLGKPVPPTVAEQTTALTEALPTTLAANPISSVDATAVVACTPAAADEFGLASVTEVAAAAGQITLGVSQAFRDATAGGLTALASAYETEFTDVVTVEASGIADAVAAGDLECVVASDLEPSIITAGLLPLADPKSVLPTDTVVPLLSIEVSTPEVVTILTQVNASLTTDVVRALLVKLAVGDDSYPVVAKDFLASISTEQ